MNSIQKLKKEKAKKIIYLIITIIITFGVPIFLSFIFEKKHYYSNIKYSNAVRWINIECKNFI